MCESECTVLNLLLPIFCISKRRFLMYWIAYALLWNLSQTCSSTKVHESQRTKAITRIQVLLRNNLTEFNITTLSNCSPREALFIPLIHKTRSMQFTRSAMGSYGYHVLNINSLSLPTSIQSHGALQAIPACMQEPGLVPSPSQCPLHVTVLLKGSDTWAQKTLSSHLPPDFTLLFLYIWEQNIDY